jgi:hypothetical protein
MANDQRAELDKVSGVGRELLRDIPCPGPEVGQVLGHLLESSADVFVVTSM